MLQKWHRKGGGSNIAPEPVLEVFVKKTKMDGECSKSCVKPLLYEARATPEHSMADERTLKADFHNLNSNTGLAHMYHDAGIIPETKDTKFGRLQVGSCLSCQVTCTESNYKAAADISAVPRAVAHLISPSYPHFPLTDLAEMVVPDNLTPGELELMNKIDLSEEDINKLEKETGDQTQ
jgi:hypothetical protein